MCQDLQPVHFFRARTSPSIASKGKDDEFSIKFSGKRLNESTKKLS